MKVWLAAMLALGLTSTVLADGGIFRGIKFGVPVKEQIDECTRSTEAYTHRSYSVPATKTCWQSGCWNESSSNCDPSVHFIVFVDSLSENPISNMAVVTEDATGLAALRLEISTGGFSILEPLFRQKYGKPVLSKESPWQSKGGVRTKAQLRVWNWNGLHISMEAPTKDVDHGEVVVATKQYFERLRKEQSDRTKRSLKDL